MNGETLTKKQQAVYDYIVQYVHHYQYPPTIREIMQCFRFKSTNAVNGYFRSLQAKGYIVFTKKAARGIRLVHQSVCPTCNGTGRI